MLILNDDALEEDKQEFSKFFEKVIDKSFKFAPSAEECARIAIPTDVANQLFAESCVTLEISNIRLIKRIEHSIRRIEPMLKDFDAQILRQAVQTLTLLGWSIYEPTRAPSLDYLMKRKAANLFRTDKKETVTNEEAAWNALLDVYGFYTMDDFDRVLLDGLRNGFFDPSLVQKAAIKLNNKIKADSLNNSFFQAWEMFHDSFADNQEQVINSIHQSFLKNARNITPLNLNGTVTLLKELGKPKQAAEIIKHYIACRDNDRKFFDLNNQPFGDEVNDPDVVQAFNEKYDTVKDEGDPTAILLSIEHGWSNEDLDSLSKLSIDEYYSMFKNSNGKKLHKMIDASLQFDRIAGASAAMTQISHRAKEALKRIGKESPINARRVRKYGIMMGAGTSADSSSG